jgi:beta-ureidopropionase / N-carbamoyl-L-amino-acid hydrolase
MSGVSQAALDQAVTARRDLAAQLFDTLSLDTAHDGIGPGVTRASYGEGENIAHRLIAATGEGLGLDVARDAAANTYVTLPGQNRSAAPVVIGSHLDSVQNGGNFDGYAGVVAGVTALAAMVDSGWTPERDIRVMGIRAEESAWFGVSYIGSRCALGQLPDGALQDAVRADTGESLADHMRDCGGDPDAIAAGDVYLDPAKLHAYLELHIEQGPVLEREEFPVGIVTGIRGNFRCPTARVSGEYSHCGGVPRAYRRDAVMAASEFVTRLDTLWAEAEESGRDMAVTIGKFFTDADEHAMTKISGAVEFSLDVRTLDPDYLDALETQVIDLAADIAARRKLDFDLGAITHAKVGVIDPTIQAALTKGAAALNVPVRAIASGAAHDAAAFAAAGVPTAMIFIRNANGSHNPHEAMELDDFMDGTRILTRWLSENA